MQDTHRPTLEMTPEEGGVISTRRRDERRHILLSSTGESVVEADKIFSIPTLGIDISEVYRNGTYYCMVHAVNEDKGLGLQKNDEILAIRLEKEFVSLSKDIAELFNKDVVEMDTFVLIIRRLNKESEEEVEFLYYKIEVKVDILRGRGGEDIINFVVSRSLLAVIDIVIPGHGEISDVKSGTVTTCNIKSLQSGDFIAPNASGQPVDTPHQHKLQVLSYSGTDNRRDQDGNVVYVFIIKDSSNGHVLCVDGDGVKFEGTNVPNSAEIRSKTTVQNSYFLGRRYNENIWYFESLIKPGYFLNSTDTEVTLKKLHINTRQPLEQDVLFQLFRRNERGRHKLLTMTGNEFVEAEEDHDRVNKPMWRECFGFLCCCRRY
ncbi:uncharacterized protein LOC106164235 isoform X2 [Lingula anatina]|uniref:Uncharacterized protein LOC106164235 isoform X2 n=1 Tax=Lingula anatina TaxID=7574 RepID=A0A1S3IHD7_LINAN|nr:uncharacterized protein LOC106164235 isoform X2 [Lingula anatina]|eukprot:XP_013397538.1 uncharacterized protein LOC106164235 isoform X2 [Lingula anatina]